MTDQDWSHIPAVRLHAQELIPSQEGVSLQRISELLAGDAPEGGDLYGRAVLWEGRVYVFDGHHRWLLACLRGDPFWARLVDVHGRVPDRDRREVGMAYESKGNAPADQRLCRPVMG